MKKIILLFSIIVIVVLNFSGCISYQDSLEGYWECEDPYVYVDFTIGGLSIVEQDGEYIQCKVRILSPARMDIESYSEEDPDETTAVVDLMGTYKYDEEKDPNRMEYTFDKKTWVFHKVEECSRKEELSEILEKHKAINEEMIKKEEKVNRRINEESEENQEN